MPWVRRTKLEPLGMSNADISLLPYKHHRNVVAPLAPLTQALGSCWYPLPAACARPMGACRTGTGRRRVIGAGAAGGDRRFVT